MTIDEWLAAFAERTGEPAPDAHTVAAILQLAATAAHASERRAAPVACWLAGASGRPLAELNRIADEISATAS